MKKRFFIPVFILCAATLICGAIACGGLRVSAESQTILEITWKNTKTTYNGEKQLPEAVFTNLEGREVRPIYENDGHIEPGNYEVKIIALAGTDANLFALPENNSVMFTIKRIIPQIVTLPQTEELLLGDPLSSVALIGGEAETYGEFEWAVKNFVPRDTSKQDVIFIPADKNHYEHIVFQIKVSVKKYCVIEFIDQENRYRYEVPVNGSFLKAQFPNLCEREGYRMIWEIEADIVPVRKDYVIHSVALPLEISANGKYGIKSVNGLTGELCVKESALSQIERFQQKQGFAVSLYLNQNGNEIVSLGESCEITIKIPDKTVSALYFYNGTEWEKLEFQQEKGNISFFSDRLGEFAILYDDTSSIIWAVVGTAITLLVGALIFVGIKIKKDLSRIKEENSGEKE